MKSRPKLVGDPDHLPPSWARETLKATERMDAQDCDICGLVGAASRGFGCFIGVRGTWACNDLDCLAEAKSRASGQRNLIAAE